MKKMRMTSIRNQQNGLIIASEPATKPGGHRPPPMLSYEVIFAKGKGYHYAPVIIPYSIFGRAKKEKGNSRPNCILPINHKVDS